MSFLVKMNQEQRVDLVDTHEDVTRMALTFIEPAIVEEWLVRATVGDRLCDFRFGRIDIVKLGETTNAQEILSRREAGRELDLANSAAARATRLLEGKDTP